MSDETGSEASEAFDVAPTNTGWRSNRYDLWDDNGLGLLANELPFRPWVRWRRAEDLGERLGLAPLKPAADEIRRSLIANLRYMAFRGPIRAPVGWRWDPVVLANSPTFGHRGVN
jgi:hypothetical protein